jgi:hypothetical protein
VSRDSVTTRIDLALEKARCRQLEIKVIYLTEDEWRAYDAEQSIEYGSRVHCFSHGAIEIRPGERSRLFSKHGESVAVPKLISARVAA